MAATISNEYREMAVQALSLNITEDEMFILILSKRGNNSFYRVDMDEQTMQPTSCCCPGFCRWQRCKHFTIIAEAFAGYVAPIVPATPVVEAAEPRITEIEAGTWYQINSNTAVYKVDGSEWIVSGSYPNAIVLVEAHIAEQQAVAEAERIVAQPATEARKVSSMVAAKVAEAARIIASGEISNETAAKFASSAESDEHTTVSVSNAAADAKKLNSYLSSQEVDLGFLGALTSNRGFQLLR